MIRGQRIRLLAERRGGRWLIRPADVAEFLARCQRAGTDGPRDIDVGLLEVRSRRLAERQRRIRARAALDRIRAMGVTI